MSYTNLYTIPILACLNLLNSPNPRSYRTELGAEEADQFLGSAAGGEEVGAADEVGAAEEAAPGGVEEEQE
jgi:hypothetical protein